MKVSCGVVSWTRCSHRCGRLALPKERIVLAIYCNGRIKWGCTELIISGGPWKTEADNKKRVHSGSCPAPVYEHWLIGASASCF